MVLYRSKMSCWLWKNTRILNLSPCTQKMCSLLPWYTEFPVYFGLLLFWNRTILCQIQIFLCPIFAKICGEMTQIVLPNSRKIFCQKSTHFLILWWYGTKFCGNLAENYAISEKLQFTILSAEPTYYLFWVILVSSAACDWHWNCFQRLESLHLQQLIRAYRLFILS
jgi:hypothetical protein